MQIDFREQAPVLLTIVYLHRSSLKLGEQQRLAPIVQGKDLLVTLEQMLSF
ncbi:hypothetical protein D3C86_2175760 [compost metagenome]